jgi:hypothetical protein
MAGYSSVYDRTHLFDCASVPAWSQNSARMMLQAITLAAYAFSFSSGENHSRRKFLI